MKDINKKALRSARIHAHNESMFYVRTLLALIWFLLVTIAAWIFLILRWGDPRVPHFFAQNMGRGVLKIFGIRAEITGLEKIERSSPCIIVGNHQSNFDVVVHGLCYPTNCIAIGKKEIAYIPLWGGLFKYTGNILLDRKNPDRARAGIEDAKNAILTRRQSIYIFPEGTRSQKPELGPFKKGAFHMAIAAQVPVLPVVASSTLEIFNERRRIARPGVVQIHVLEPIETKGLTGQDVEKLMNETRDAMAKELTLVKTTVLE